MRHTPLGIIAVALATALLTTSANAQTRPRLHVSTRWEECSIQLDPSLSQSAWHQFTAEAAQVVYFRPLADARPMGRGRFEVALMQWQTNVDDNTPAWNDTFVHPDSTHWLYEGSGLQFPGLALRAGVTAGTDVGVYFTQNVKANYGAFGVQLQQNLFGRGARTGNVASRVSFVSLFGPADVDVNVYGVDVVASWKPWSLSRATVTPYAAVGTYLATSHEKAAAVNLADEQVLGVMGTAGAALQVSAVRIAAEASLSRVPSIAMKFGIGR
jgi:hypothetical protein